jgi:phage gp29-like protein
MISDRLGAESMAVTDAAFMAPIKRLVESANSLEEIRDGILNIYADLDPAELGELIARAMASADLAGRYEARSSKLKAQSSKGNENA